MGQDQAVLTCIGVCVGIVALLVVILIPMSFVGLEWYEMGFKRSKSTGSVDTDRVYTFGLHFIGPDAEFKKFRASAHFEDFRKITIFSKDRLEMVISCSLQYFLRPHQLQGRMITLDSWIWISLH